jgi:hypothetical protein
MNSPIFNICLACAGFSLTCCTNTYEHTSRSVAIPASQDAVQIKADEYDTFFERRYGLLFRTFADEPFSGRIVTIENENGRDFVATDETYKAGKRDGLSARGFPDGQKMYERHYHEGKWHGLVTRWWPNGQKMYVRAYTDGQRHGQDVTWRSDGTQIDLSIPITPAPVRTSSPSTELGITTDTSIPGGQTTLPEIETTIDPVPSFPPIEPSSVTPPVTSGTASDALPGLPANPTGLDTSLPATSGFPELSPVPTLDPLPLTGTPIFPPLDNATSTGGLDPLPGLPLDATDPAILSDTLTPDPIFPPPPPSQSSEIPLTPPPLDSGLPPAPPPLPPLDNRLPDFPPLDSGSVPESVDPLPAAPLDFPAPVVEPPATPDFPPAAPPAPAGDLPGFPPLDSSGADPVSSDALLVPPPPTTPALDLVLPPPLPSLDTQGGDAGVLPPLPGAIPAPADSGGLPPLPPLP